MAALDTERRSEAAGRRQGVFTTSTYLVLNLWSVSWRHIHCPVAPHESRVMSRTPSCHVLRCDWLVSLMSPCSVSDRTADINWTRGRKSTVFVIIDSLISERGDARELITWWEKTYLLLLRRYQEFNRKERNYRTFSVNLQIIVSVH